MHTCTSILNPIVEEVKERMNKGSKVEELKSYVITEVNKHTQMNEEDRIGIIQKVSRMGNSLSLLKYLYDSLLQFEGYGVIKSGRKNSKDI